MKRDPNSLKKTKAHGVEKTAGGQLAAQALPASATERLQQVATLLEEREDILRLALEIANARPAPSSSRWGARQRAADLRERMATFGGIYHAAWMVRYFQHGDPARRKKAAVDFCQVLMAELPKCTDPEALIFAVADSITCSPHGLPWEG